MLNTLLSYLQGGNVRDAVLVFILSIPTVLISLSLHEAMHGYAAFKCGDPTARALGRLTINPLKHLDPIGSVCMLLFGFGWAKPVPVNTRYFKNPKVGMAITAAAGPLTNFVLGFIGTFFCFVFHLIFINTAHKLIFVIYLFFYLFAIMNFSFCFFNLIPVPPFDGSRIAFVFLPANWYFRIMKYERIIMILVLAGFWSGFLSMGDIAYSVMDFFFNTFGKIYISLFL